MRVIEPYDKRRLSYLRWSLLVATTMLLMLQETRFTQEFVGTYSKEFYRRRTSTCRICQRRRLDKRPQRVSDRMRQQQTDADREAISLCQYGSCSLGRRSSGSVWILHPTSWTLTRRWLL